MLSHHRCAGSVPVTGHHNSTQWFRIVRHLGGGAAARVTSTGAVVLHLRRRRGGAASRPGSRIYLADRCAEREPIDAGGYAALSMLGQTLSFTVDLTQAKCGCVVAAYLVPMRENTHRGSCGDFYCDANRVCGVGCSEIGACVPGMCAACTVRVGVTLYLPAPSSPPIPVRPPRGLRPSHSSAERPVPNLPVQM